jgi:hypothetical protein
MAEAKAAEKAKEKTEEKGPKNIYAKMAAVKSKLLGIKKGGTNEFAKYSYFELGDILPVLTPALEEERLYMKTQFSATEQVAKLIIIDIDTPESSIDFEIRFAECALKGAHEIQNLGAAQTYTRRYLIMTAFDIAEADIVDSGESEQDEKKAAQKKNEQKNPPKNQQPPADDNPPPQDNIQLLQRQTWNLIKKLPQEEQARWINSCKGADAAKLKDFIERLSLRLNAPDDGKRLENLKAEFSALVEALPEDAQGQWIDLACDADEAKMKDLLTQVKADIAYLEGDQKQVGPADAELEIF